MTALAKKLINAFGYEVKKLTPSSKKARTSIEESYRLIRKNGVQPKSVIDVGVANGTPELYRSFPNCYFLLIEPLKEFELDLKTILEKHAGSYILAAAGSEAGETILNVHEDHLDGSSLHKETMGPKADGVERLVPIVKIDDLIADKNLEGPYLLKLDIQGAELTALDGAAQTLINTDVVVMEVSLFKFMIGAPDFYEVVNYMKEREFVVYDIIHGWNRPLDNA